MEFEFDPAKDIANSTKHGVSLAMAVELDWNNALVWPDTRQNYGEDRMCALAAVRERVHFVVFVDRDDIRRIISLRKANEREVRFYAENA